MCHGVSSQAFERLLNGDLNALHTLACLEPAGSIDPVAICVGSDVGLGAIAAVLKARQHPLLCTPCNPFYLHVPRSGRGE